MSLYIDIDGHTKSSKTLALKIQEAYIKNDIIRGDPQNVAMQNLPVPIIKILFEKGWLYDYWEYLPYNAPWEELDIENSPLRFYSLKNLLLKRNFKEKVKKTPTIQIADFVVNKTPLPKEIPEKIIINQYLADILEPGDREVSSHTIKEIIKYINHKETKIEIKPGIYPDIPDNILKDIINNIENETLYYFCLYEWNINNIPEAMKKFLLKPIPYDVDNWQEKRTAFLLLNNLAVIHINQKTVANLFIGGTYINHILEPIKEIDFTNGPIEINL
jgi:hypothetical protein